MNNKRHLDNPESSNTKRTQLKLPENILSYFKNHYTYQTFNSKDLLYLLNCDTPETAIIEAKKQLNNIIDLKNINEEVRKFVTHLLLDKLKCLSDSNADIYWMEKKSTTALITSSHKQLQVYHHVSSDVMDHALMRIQPDDQPICAPSPTPSVETELSVENIWSIWSDVVYNMITEENDDQDINRYSLEYLGIITLGDHIGNKQTRKFYPKELVSETNKIIHIPNVDVFRKFSSFYPQIFESLDVSLDACHTLLLKNSLKVKNTDDPCMQFTFDFFMIFVTQILKDPVILTKQESIYNYRAIYRFLDAVISATPSYTFFPGETRLQSINKEFNRLEMITNSFYNADGIIVDNDSELEICLLETSGPFGLINISRETRNHIKAAYGLLSMIHTVAYQFIYADIEVFKKLKICFIHPASDRIQLWYFSLADKELYLLNRVDSAILPTKKSDQFKTKFMHVTNLFWKLKMSLDDAKVILEEIKASHEKNKAAYDDGVISNLPRLDDYLVENAEVKLSSRISESSEIFFSSSPFQPDSS